MVYPIDCMMVFCQGIFTGRFLRRSVIGLLPEDKNRLHPALELLNGLLYVLVFWETGWTVEGILFCICASILLGAGIVDQKIFEIPAACTILIGILGAVHLGFDFGRWREYLAGLFAASSFLLALYLLTKGKGMGGGDIKLMAAAGLLLGWERILLALFIGAAAGGAVHGLLMKLKNKGRVLAFGPYLAFGIFTAMVYGDKIL